MQNNKQWQNKMVCSCLVLSDYALQQCTSSLNSDPVTTDSTETQARPAL